LQHSWSLFLVDAQWHNSWPFRSTDVRRMDA